MNAVNLIPNDQRRRGRSSVTGLPFIAVVCGLVIVLVATVLFVMAHDRVDSRASRLAAIQASTARWSQAAGTYADDVTADKLRATTIAGVESLAGQRADWSLLLGELAAVMPAHSQLSSLSATDSGSSGASSATGAAMSTGATTDGSQIQLSACAASQVVIAQTMVALRRVSGVSGVYLGTDSNSSTGTSGSSGGAGATGSCAYPVTFAVSLTFTPPTSSSSTAATVKTSVSPSSTSSTAGASQ